MDHLGRVPRDFIDHRDDRTLGSQENHGVGIHFAHHCTLLFVQLLKQQNSSHHYSILCSWFSFWCFSGKFTSERSEQVMIFVFITGCLCLHARGVSNCTQISRCRFMFWHGQIGSHINSIHCSSAYEEISTFSRGSLRRSGSHRSLCLCYAPFRNERS